MPELDKETTKEAVKEALKEWLDEKYAQVGKWTLHGLMAMAVGATAWMILISQGWHK